MQLRDTPTRNDAPSSRRRTRIIKTKTSYEDRSSSPGTRRKPQPKKANSSEKLEEVVYETKYQAILKEKKELGRIKYLVNWADNSDTGEVYTPTWVRTTK